MRTDHNRRPRGFSNAARNKVRGTKRPPTNYDDIRNNKYAPAFDYGKRLFPQVHTFGEFYEKFNIKYPTFQRHEVKAIFKEIRDNG